MMEKLEIFSMTSQHQRDPRKSFFSCHVAPCRVARWSVFKPKIRIWANFGGPWNGKCWYILWPFGIFYGLLVLFMSVWYSLWSFVIFFPFWYVCTKKNLATMRRSTLRAWVTGYVQCHFFVYFPSKSDAVWMSVLLKQQDIKNLIPWRGFEPTFLRSWGRDGDHYTTPPR
jgi:hypothetical protein